MCSARGKPLRIPAEVAILEHVDAKARRELDAHGLEPDRDRRALGLGHDRIGDPAKARDRGGKIHELERHAPGVLPVRIAPRAHRIAELERERALRERIEIDERRTPHRIGVEQEVRDLEVAMDVARRQRAERRQLRGGGEDLERERISVRELAEAREVLRRIVHARARELVVVVEIRDRPVKPTDELPTRLGPGRIRHRCDRDAIDPRRRAPHALVLETGAAIERAEQARRDQALVHEMRGHSLEIEVHVGPEDRVQALQHRDRLTGRSDRVRRVDQAAGQWRELIDGPAPRGGDVARNHG